MPAHVGVVVRHRKGGRPTPLDEAWTLVRAALEPYRRRPSLAAERELRAALLAYRDAVVGDMLGDPPDAGPAAEPDPLAEPF